MHPKIRVFIVDDSVVIRKILSETLGSDPDIEVAGYASNGKIALHKLPQISPDIVTLDFEMPELDGLETLKQIRALYPKLPVIMFSALTERGAAATLDAFACGASDYCTKPTAAESMERAKEAVQRELTAKIKSLCGRSRRIAKEQSGEELVAAENVSEETQLLESKRQLRRREKQVDAEIVAIGVSTGGPNALAEVIPAFPENFPLPIVVVQHMPPVFTRLLAERLAAKSRLRAVEGESGMSLEPGCVYIAPGDFHMEVVQKRLGVELLLQQGPPENSCRPAVDVLFRSIAKVFGPKSLAVVLTGMGQDGKRGCEEIVARGGQIVVQDEETSVVWGMPGAVVHAGLAELILPIKQIAPEIIRRVCKQQIISQKLCGEQVSS